MADSSGPAFPTRSDDIIHHGMFLRDYFAGQLVAGSLLLSNLSDADIAERVSLAYRIADAMLKHRQS